MLSKIPKLLAPCLVIVACSSVVACSSGQPAPEPAVKEVPNPHATHLDKTQDELIATAMRNYYARLFTPAQEAFETLRDNFSPGPYAEFSEIKVADIHFELRNFDQAATAYDTFLKNHPGSSSIPYVLYRLGRSCQEMNRGVGRDAAPLERSRDAFQRVIDEFPQSVYAAESKHGLADVMTRLGEYENLVSDFYRNRQNVEASRVRDEEYRAALKPKITAAELIFRESESEEMAKRASLGSKPATIDPASDISDNQPTGDISAAAATVVSAPPNGSKTDEALLTAIECDHTSSSKLFLYLARPLSEEELDAVGVGKPQGDIVRLKFPGTARRNFSLNCFGEEDTRVAINGEVTITTSLPLSIIPLSNPNRILIAQ